MAATTHNSTIACAGKSALRKALKKSGILGIRFETARAPKKTAMTTPQIMQNPAMVRIRDGMRLQGQKATKGAVPSRAPAVSPMVLTTTSIPSRRRAAGNGTINSNKPQAACAIQTPISDR